MAGMRIEWKRNAIKDLLRSPDVLDDLEARARRIARAAGPGDWPVDSQTGRNRARASVRTGDHTARRAEATSAALTRSVDAAR